MSVRPTEAAGPVLPLERQWTTYSAEQRKQHMRILVTACPFFGHVNTVLAIAVAARRAGHEVVVATGADFVGYLARRGLPAWPVGPTAAESGIPLSPADFGVTAAKRAVDLLPRAAAWGPDLVVSEELEFAGVIVAARTGVRYAVHGLGIAAAGDVDVFVDDIDELGRQWGMSRLADTYRRAPRLSVCPPSLRPPGTPGPVLPVRAAIGEPAADDRLPAALADLPFERTVHLTLGTVFHERRPGVLEAAIAGLREIGANVVVTVGPGVDPGRFGPQPPHVVVEGYLPHALLLPRCDLVASQGGAGILLGGLAHGLPQLVLPQGADQFANAEVARQAGVGLVLEGAEVTAPAVASAATRLFSDPSYTAAARRIQAEIAAMPPADQALAALVAGA
jgi:UDP:flavonoid glycosyltransferase YjiC (YdhE family)